MDGEVASYGGKQCGDGEIGVNRDQVSLYLWTQVGHAPEGVEGVAFTPETISKKSLIIGIHKK